MASNDERRRRLELRNEFDDLKAELLVLWGKVRKALDDLEQLENDSIERRVSQASLEAYRAELPSETQLSLRPTGMRVFLKNNRPSTFVVLVLVVGVVALAWVLRPR